MTIQIKFGLTALSILISMTGCTSATPKPDLIIENVTFRGAQQNDPLYDGPPLIEYTFHVKNIGNAPFQGYLYVSWTGSDWDMNNNHYSQGSRLRASTDPPIKPNETYLGTALDQYQDNTEIRFIINNPRDSDIPPNDESNFVNNTFILKFK
jgi:hypothetical protein